MFTHYKIIILWLILLVCLPAQTLLAENSPKLLKIAGWDVYSDPERKDKTIGYKRFEQKTGVIIKFTPLSNLDDIISVAESDEYYDLYIISNEGIRVLHDMDLVEPLKLENIPNYQNLHHNLKYSNWSLFDSEVYAIPWAWGPTGLIYDKNIISNADSWDILWDPRFKGKVAMWNDISMIWTTALSLGYKNVYSLTKKQLEKVKAKLLVFNKISGIYYKGSGDDVQLAKEGKLVAFNSWYDPSAQLNLAGKKNFAMTIPKEGAVGMFDSYLIKKGNTDIKTAYQYINHQISPETQKEMVRITGLSPANIETLSILKPSEIKALHLDNQDYFNYMLLWDHMPRKNLYEAVLKEVRENMKGKE